MLYLITTHSQYPAYDQVVVFDSKSTSGDDSTVITPDASEENETGAAFLIRILRYLETPQYLRKSLFPKHNSLKFVVRTQFLVLPLLVFKGVNIFTSIFVGNVAAA